MSVNVGTNREPKAHLTGSESHRPAASHIAMQLCCIAMAALGCTKFIAGQGIAFDLYVLVKRHPEQM